MSIAKRLIYWCVVLLCAVAALEAISTLIAKWDTLSIVRKSVKILVCFGWVYITYNAITLKYKWLRKLIGKNN